MRWIGAMIFVALVLTGYSRPGSSVIVGRYTDSDWPMPRMDRWRFNADGTWSQATTYPHRTEMVVTRYGTYLVGGATLFLYSDRIIERIGIRSRELSIPFSEVPETLQVVHRNRDLVLTKNNGSTDTVLHPGE